MSNSYFQFKQFTIHQDRCAMKVATDVCLFGAIVSSASLSRKIRVLDLGTGTGLLALMFAQKNPESFIDAVEIDEETAEQATENVQASLWKNRINVIQADARNYLFSGKYDVIISNPPFYENELRSSDTKKNIARHSEGLLLKELLALIERNLDPGGMFFLLLPYKRDEEIKNLLMGHQLAVIRLVLIRQSPQHNYFRIMLTGKFKTGEPAETIIDEIMIRDEKQQYTKEFVGLLKDYYLYL